MRPVLAQEEQHVCVRFPFKEMKYLTFSLLCSGVEAELGVKFRHSIRNVATQLKKSAESVKGILLKLGSLSLRSSVKKKENKVVCNEWSLQLS